MQSIPSIAASPSLLRPPVTAMSKSHVSSSGRQGVDARHSMWSTSQFSELQLPRRVGGGGSDGVQPGSLDLAGKDNHHQRSQSLSTAAEHERSLTGKHRGELRIVIERAEDHPQLDPPAQPPKTPLDISIPHYRLGTPQFKPDGQPMLRSSVYTATSMSDQLQSSNVVEGAAAITPSPHRASYSAPQYDHIRSRSAAMSLFSNIGPVGVRNSTASPRKSGLYTLTEPIEPSMFDRLSEEMEDPSIIRYIPGTTDISAATPARIIAQISSDSFMDYELVSDFFLTFRCYLSTTDLLSLLMARLHWAINRLQDDGRIIRIRTFAALRHWILNYFVDDFVIDRDLRVQFCNQINTMYDGVKQIRGESTSDLKILVDLKRCWYGRCALYWDCLDLVDSDTPVIPGGVAGSRDVNKARLSEISVSNTPAVADAILSSSLSVEPDQHPIQIDGKQSERVTDPPSHSRSMSSGAVLSAPMSVGDQSVQPVSTLPLNTLKRTSLPSDNSNVTPPVPTQTNPLSESTFCRSPQCAKARHPHPVHKHKRSGSFSDSLRDDRARFTPLPQVDPEEARPFMLQSATTSSCLIRGQLLPPGDAFVNLTRSPSPTMMLSTHELQTLGSRSSSEGNIKNHHMSPGVRTLIGSIRRALHGKAPGSVVYGNLGPPAKGRTAALPVNIAFRSASYRDRNVRSLPKIDRIDVLCDQISKDYHDALGISREKQWQLADFDVAAFHLDVRRPSQDLDPKLHVTTSGDERLPSEVTTGSESIVIVDDTGTELPLMSGGGTLMTDSAKVALQSNRLLAESTDAHLSLLSKDQDGRVSPGHTLADAFDGRSVASDAVSKSPYFKYSRFSGRQSGISLSRLRKYASFSSALNRPSVEGGAGLRASELTPERDNRPLGRMLRRKPGGDLKKARDLHDLPVPPRTQSAISDSSLGDSLAPSALASGPALVNPRTVSPAVSLIHTHSSQQLRRPSFEAAVAGFSQIPDDGDGGIESTLLKLEGKWQRSPTREGSTNVSQIGSSESDQVHIWDNPQETPAFGFQEQKGQQVVVSELYSGSFVESEYSYSSVPLLERGLSDESMKKPFTDPYPPTEPNRTIDQGNNDEDKSMRRPTRGSQLSESAGNAAHYNVSELSSELSVSDVVGPGGSEILSDSEGLASEGLVPAGLALDFLPHPLAHPPSPPSPPMTASRPARPSTPPSFPPEPLTPGPSPTQKRVISSPDAAEPPDSPEKYGPTALSLQPNHVPFILGLDSQTLARQLTLVEKAALNEVDWKDLVEMKWNNTPSSACSWVQFLSERERKGIDLVVGRFNLVVKWILSEIVLTKDTAERGLVLTKYIHVATHARRICNYATMLQVTIALSSSNCTRLRRTWDLVSQEDKRLLKDMENLIQPVRNFHDLRMEMETANLHDGCIPFVGMLR